MHTFFAVFGALVAFYGLQYLMGEWTIRREIRRAEFYRYAPPDVFPIGWVITIVGVVTFVLIVVMLNLSHH